MELARRITDFNGLSLEVLSLVVLVERASGKSLEIFRYRLPIAGKADLPIPVLVIMAPVAMAAMKLALGSPRDPGWKV